MGLGAVKKELKKLNKDELISLIADLYNKHKSIKEFLDFYVTPDETELLKKYKDKILNAMFPRRGYNFKPKEARQAIHDFKKLEPSQDVLADLMLYYVETGVEFMNIYGDINGAFYNSMATELEGALNLLRDQDALNKFAERVGALVDKTKELEWGFHEFVLQTWFDFYPDDDDEINDGEDENTDNKSDTDI